MRKIVGGVFQSLDGVMQAPGGPIEDTTGGFTEGGWLTGLFDEVTGAAIGKLFTPPYALLLGRRTYETFAAYWPYVDMDGENGSMGAALNGCDKYVLTHGTAPLLWENSHRLADIAALAALKADDGPDLLIQGSSTIYPALLEQGLLDRLTVFTFPVVIGAGKRTFATGTPTGALALIEHQVSPNGIVIATYEPAGEIRRSPFEEVASNPREDERQRQIKDGTW